MVKTASLYSRTYIYGSEVKRIYTDRTANMYGEAAGLEVSSIQDKTPIPHNGCRPKKRRRV